MLALDTGYVRNGPERLNAQEPVFVTVSEFREHIRRGELDLLLDQVLLAREARHVSAANIQFIEDTLRAKYRVRGQIDIWINGSAKLGFSPVEKRIQGGILPRYRRFSADSDLDVVVVSPEIFGAIWDDLSTYSHRSAWFPWRSGKLGDYLVCGWLRPDKFPIEDRPPRCVEWWETFNALTADPRFGRRKVRGALFSSVDELRKYMRRCLRECAIAEGVEL